nr:uncharacterized protein LOC110356982 [Columba livia]
MTHTTVCNSSPLILKPEKICKMFLSPTLFTDGSSDYLHDPKYAFGICHSVGALWKERCFLTSAGHTIAHGQLIHDLLLAIQEPREIAVIYIYDELDEEELNKWKHWEATQQDGIWKLGDKPLLPVSYVLPLTRWIHDRTHGGPEAVASKIQQLWAAPGVYSAAKRLTDSCTLCKKYGVTKVTTVPGKRRLLTFLFRNCKWISQNCPLLWDISIFLLLLISFRTGWKPFLLARTIRKLWLRPCFVISFREAAFHTPYHPQSSGQVEQMNRTIKDHLAKVTADTGLKWPEALPLVLWDLRTTPHATTKLSLAEDLFRRVLTVLFTFMSAKTALLEGDEAVTQYLLYLQQFARIRNYMHWYQGVTPEIQKLRNLSQTVLQNRMALDILLASQGGVCTMLNSSCCMYINKSKQLVTEVDKIWEVSHVMQQIQRDDADWGVADLWQWMTSWFPDLGTLVKKILMTVIVIVFVIIFVLIQCMSMFCNCCCNLLNQQKLYYRYQ